MLTVNLLPWREQIKAKHQSYFKMLVLLICISTATICYFIYQHSQTELTKIQKQIKLLTQKAAKNNFHKENNVTIKIKSIKSSSLFSATEFELLIDRSNAGFENAMD